MRRVLAYAPKSLGNSGNDVQVWIAHVRCISANLVGRLLRNLLRTFDSPAVSYPSMGRFSVHIRNVRT